MIFKRHPNTSLFLWVAPEQSNSQPNSVFIAYYLPEVLEETETDDTDTLTLEADPNESEPEDDPNESQPEGDLDELTLEQSWKSCLGYYLFVKSFLSGKPEEDKKKLDTFAAAVSTFLKNREPEHTGFLWLTYDGASVTPIDSIETKTDETDSSRYDLRLMLVGAADGLLNEGRNLVIVALVGTELHIRIFDANGKIVVDKAENELVSGETVTGLKKQLTPIPDESGLSKERKQKIIGDATSIAGHTHSSKVVLLNEVLLDFGGYKLPFGKDTPVIYEGQTEPSGFVFLVPPKPPNRYPPSDTPIPAPSDGVHLTFEGERRGCFECLTLIGDYYSHKSTSWHVGLRYAVNVNEKVAHQFYPVFDLRDGRRPLLKMCWDLTDHLNPDRTFLEFQAQSKKLVSAGRGKCNYRLKTPDHPEIVPTYFRTVTGEVIGVIPKKGSAKLVFELWTEYPDPRLLDDLESAGDWHGEMEPPPNSRYYLVPSGQFELVLIDVDEKKGYAFEPITSVEEQADKKAEIPSQFLCGLSGIESVEFTPRDKDDERIEIPGDSIEFFPRKPAYVPAFPLTRASGSKAAEVKDLELIQRKYLTAWIDFAGADEGFAYFSQPEEAPLYTAEDNNSEDELITFFEPVAAKLPLASLQHSQNSFPVAPAAGVTPASEAPEPKAFLKSLENQIIGPYRREVIRKFADSSASDDATTTVVTALTPQGFKATVGARETVNERKTVKTQKWTKLLLARKTGTDKKQDFELSFSDLHPTLQAAFQSNQLFLVASSNAHFNGFSGKVKMGGWEFDLSPSESGLTNLNNILIFKFSPGKLIERIHDPRSWTNPKDFSTTDTAKLSKLASELKKFFDLKEKLGDPATARYYEGLQAIIEDELWTGIIGVNVEVKPGALPPDLKMLAAGVDKLVAHHIVIETSTLEYTPPKQPASGGPPDPGKPPGPAECSLFGLIDYRMEPKATELKDQPVDFAVTRLRAHFLKGELADFSCKAKLTLRELFGEKVKPTKQIGFVGIRERHQGRDTYSLVIDPKGLEGGDSVLVGPVDPTELRRAKLDSSVIDFVAIDKIEFQVSEADKHFTVTFSFWGTIKFQETSFDLFSYDSLPFSGLLVRMDVPKYLAPVVAIAGSTVKLGNARGFEVKHPVNKVGAGEKEAGAIITSISGNTLTLNATIATLAPEDWIEVTGTDFRTLRKSTIDLGGLALDGTSTAVPPRDNSLVKKFPMKLQKFYNSASGADPTKEGYVPVKTDFEGDPLGQPVYGLDFTLNLGTLGEFASNAGISVGLLLAWSPKPPPRENSPAAENSVKVFLKFPGVSAAKTDLFSLQGVVKLGASEYALKAYSETVTVIENRKAEQKAVTSWVLMLNGMALRVLGEPFPPKKTNIYIFGPPPDQPQQEPEMPLGWYAVYQSGRKP